MYDITFILSCCLSNDPVKKYIDRLLFFKKYGLLNLRDHKIKVILNINKNDDSNNSVLRSWDYDTEILISKHNHIAPKSYSFFSNLKEEHISNTKWLMRIDDDSLTNVDHLLNQLNKEFDYAEPLYIMSKHSCSYGRGVIYNDILKRYGLEKYINKPYNIRELESCIISQAALYNISDFSSSNNFLKSIIKEIEDDGHGDALMSCVAYAANCKIKMVDYMSWYPSWDKLVNKELSHIHFIFRGDASINKEGEIAWWVFCTTAINNKYKPTANFFLTKLILIECLKKMNL